MKKVKVRYLLWVLLIIFSLSVIPTKVAFAEEDEKVGKCIDQTESRVRIGKYFTTVRLSIDIYNKALDEHYKYKDETSEIEGNVDADEVKHAIEDFENTIEDYREQYEYHAKKIVDTKASKGIVESCIVLRKIDNTIPIAPEEVKEIDGKDDTIKPTADMYQVYELSYSSIVDYDLIDEVVVDIKVPTVGTEVKVDTVQLPCKGMCPDDDSFIVKTQDPTPTVTPLGPTKEAYKQHNAVWIKENSDESDLFSGVIEADKDYYASVMLLPNDGYLFSKNPKVVGNNDAQNVTIYPIDGFFLGFTVKVHVPASDDEGGEQIVYYFIDEDNQTYQGEDLTFHSSGPLEELTAVKVNDDILAKRAYRLANGSTILTLLSSYLDTLDAGTYTLTLSYGAKGDLSTTFTIPTTTSGPDDILPAQATTATSVTNPATADDIASYIISGIVSLVSLIGVIVVSKK